MRVFLRLNSGNFTVQVKFTHDRIVAGYEKVLAPAANHFRVLYQLGDEFENEVVTSGAEHFGYREIVVLIHVL